MGTHLTTAKAFKQLDEALLLDPDERDAAIELHNDITALLHDQGLIVAWFLQGSFARKTMLAPLRDIDKVVIISSSLARLSPDQVMTKIQDAIVAAYPDARFKRSRHALQVDFGETSFLFDTVPAKETDTEDDDVLIANRETGEWDRSNTRELIRTIAARNQETDGRFIHWVRMAKQVVKHLLDGSIPGLHVESWAYLAVTTPLDDDEAVARILEAAADLITGTYTEPTGVDTISNRLKPDVIATAAPVLVDAAARAREARVLTDGGDDNEAIRLWHGLFGDCFPAPTSEGAASALKRSFGGAGITKAGGVSAVAGVRQQAAPARSWRRS